MWTSRWHAGRACPSTMVSVRRSATLHDGRQRWRPVALECRRALEPAALPHRLSLLLCRWCSRPTTKSWSFCMMGDGIGELGRPAWHPRSPGAASCWPCPWRVAPPGKQGCTACTFTQRTVPPKLIGFSPLAGELSEEVVARASWSFRANKQQAVAFSSPLNYLPAIGNDDFVQMNTQGSASPFGDP